jgi:acetyl esterase/lipase
MFSSLKYIVNRMEAVSKSSVETLLERPINPINDIPSAIPMPPLDPASQALIDEELEQDAPPVQDLTPEQLRATTAQLQKHTPIPGVAVTEFSVKPLNDPEDKSIRTFMFRPMGAENEDLPVIFYLHGGGWISGT